jgi:hypothetical protein
MTLNMDGGHGEYHDATLGHFNLSTGMEDYTILVDRDVGDRTVGTTFTL